MNGAVEDGGEEKEERLSQRIDYILSVFCRQYAKQYASMKVSGALSSIVDKEVNREAYCSVARYYHIDSKRDESFEPVYGLKIASSRTEIGRDRNEYTAYIIVGSCMTPFGSKLTVCVKRFVELRAFARELEKKMNEVVKNNKIDFPFHYRLFGLINESKLQERKDLINLFFEKICDNASIVRSPIFLNFFHFNQIKDTSNGTKANNYNSNAKWKNDCIEETLQAMKEAKDNNVNIINHDDDDANDLIKFETPIDLHHYKDAQYKLIASVFDTIYREMELEEENNLNESKTQDVINENGNGNEPFSNRAMRSYSAASSSGGHARTPSIMRPYLQHVRSGSIIASTFSPAISLIGKSKLSYISESEDLELNEPVSRGRKDDRNGSKSGRSKSRGRKRAGTDFDDTNKEHFSDYKNVKRSKVLTEDRGPRIIRLAAEATSEESLSYKIPTKVHEMWDEANEIINIKVEKKVLKLIDACKNSMYPMIQECIHDVVPIAKDLIQGSRLYGGLYEKSIEPNNNINNNMSSINDLKENGDGYESDSSDSADTDVVGSSLQLHHFPMIKAMKQYCLIEKRLFEYLIAFENLSIEKVYHSKKLDFSKLLSYKYKLLSLSSSSSKSRKGGTNGAAAGADNNNNHNNGDVVYHDDYDDDDEEFDSDDEYGGGHGMNKRQSQMMNEEFLTRIRQIERIHEMISTSLCDVLYHLLKTFVKECISLIINYKDELEDIWETNSLSFGFGISETHEERLLSILRECGYNISLVCDELKQKILSKFGNYSGKIFFPILEGIVNMGELSANCLALIISNLSFDENISRISDISDFRQHFVNCWEEPIDYFLSDISECLMNTLYQSCVGLVCSASHDLLTSSIINMSSSAHSHSSSQWFQILTKSGHGAQIPHGGGGGSSHGSQGYNALFARISKYITIKEVLNIVINRALTNVVEERLIFLRLDAQKKFFKKILS